MTPSVTPTVTDGERSAGVTLPRPDPTRPVRHPSRTQHNNVRVETSVCSYRAELERELQAMFGPNWRTPLPADPTPRQELAARRRDAERLHKAERVVRYRRRVALGVAA